MKAAVYLPEPFCRNVRIDLRCADLGVAEQLLYNAQISSVLEKVGRETVPECVRCDTPFNAGVRAEFFYYFPHAHTAERSSRRISEKEIPLLRRRKQKKGLHRRTGLIAQRHDPLFSPLAQTFEKTTFRFTSFTLSEISSLILKPAP